MPSAATFRSRKLKENCPILSAPVTCTVTMELETLPPRSVTNRPMSYWPFCSVEGSKVPKLPLTTALAPCPIGCQALSPAPEGRSSS